jgi:hypothetical protein
LRAAHADIIDPFEKAVADCFSRLTLPWTFFPFDSVADAQLNDISNIDVDPDSVCAAMNFARDSGCLAFLGQVGLIDTILVASKHAAALAVQFKMGTAAPSEALIAHVKTLRLRVDKLDMLSGSLDFDGLSTGRLANELVCLRLDVDLQSLTVRILPQFKAMLASIFQSWQTELEQRAAYIESLCPKWQHCEDSIFANPAVEAAMLDNPKFDQILPSVRAVAEHEKQLVSLNSQRLEV